ncbi:hypothetical protein NA57DRAFT_53339 [Rhizodiscina lignyota]|uniref:Uncharacterized protein n=1 Tax=Rhizodiscina lignyota TaxID=1504668 RepID=A0A9P4MBG6_9PEZI|nr:hypothetical protein NA57DRAFT_53339 [Rhizodiscina lignyota]
MPPIRTFQDAPLHPEGVTPKTAEAEGQSGSVPASNVVPAPTRTIPQPASQSTGPPPPQPGARPIPGPAPTSSSHGGPAPPMPGANPNYTPSVTATVTTTTTSAVPPPEQLNIPPPSSNYTPTKSTSSAPPPPRTGQVQSPTRIDFGASPVSPVRDSTDNERHSLEHPPGYVQNPYASDGTAVERARLEATAMNDKNESVWGAVKSAATEVGKYAQKVEHDAWQWIDGKASK